MANTFKIFILRHGQSELNHENIFCGWIDAKLTQKGLQQAKNSGQLISKYCQDNHVALPPTVYISRLVRTKQTMQVIMDDLYHMPQVDSKTQVLTNFNYNIDSFPVVLETWRLNERHYGAWQGQKKDVMLDKYGKEQYMFIRRNYMGKPPVADLQREMVQEVNDQGSSTGYLFKEPNRHIKYSIEEANERQPLPNGESLQDVVKRLKPFIDNVILDIAKKYNHESCLIIGHGSSVRSILKIFANISDDEIKDIDVPNGIPLVIELNKDKNFEFVNRFYLDPENARINAQKVRNEGFKENK